MAKTNPLNILLVRTFRALLQDDATKNFDSCLQLKNLAHSQIIAGGGLNITGQAVDNRGRTISVNAQRNGTAYFWSNYNEGCGGFDGCDYNYNAYRDGP